MKVIARGRGAGKTTELILESARTGRYILVHERSMVDYIANTAKKLGVSIPYPITVEEVRRGNISGSLYRNGILVDNAEYVLGKLLGIRIHTLTVSTTEEVSE